VELSDWTPLDVEACMLGADLRPMGEGRPGGVHVGDVVRAAKVAAGESVVAPEGDQPGMRMQEGFIFETIVEYMLGGLAFDAAVELAFKRHCLALRAGVVKQVRLERDGIHGTPDALDPSVPQLESYKSTRRSLRRARDNFEGEFWPWVMQEEAYCYMAGVDRVRLIVWWHAGDYSRGKGTGPQVMEMTARFTPEELERNWSGVCTIAARMSEEG
jgi:hypothetical protein